MRGVWAFFLLTLLRAAPVLAHDVRGTMILLDVGQRKANVEIQMSVPELQRAFRMKPSLPGTPAPLPSPATLAQYVAQHFSAMARNGQPFRSSLQSVDVEQIADGECAVVRLELTAPQGQDARWLELHSDLITHQVVSHNVYVLLRRDLRTGRLEGSPTVLGMMHFQKQRQVVDLSSGSAWTAFRSMFSLGMRHIEEGTDHLMFLLVLLLPASLLAVSGRWRGVKSVRRSFQDTLLVASAFTLGHSVTLLFGALKMTPVPVQLVETLIAFSILVSAVHAWRPLFPGREAWIAAGFGLIHGLAFATVLAGVGVDASTLVLSLLGFNLGIEAMQFAVVLLVLPCLLVLSRSPIYLPLRGAGAALGAVAASGWILERGLSLRTGIPDLVERLAAQGLWVWGFLLVLAGISLLAGRITSNGRTNRAAPSPGTGPVSG